MTNQIHDRPTWVHFQLRQPLPVIELARLVESIILSVGLVPQGDLEPTIGAASSLPSGQTERYGVRITDVILEDGPLLSAASARYGMRDGDLEISFRIGDADTPPFDAATPRDNFTLRVNCRMDRNRLRQIAETISEQVELELCLRNPKTAYRLIKQLFSATGAEKCIGVDDKYVTGQYFTDPPGFFFSRTAPWILSELLEESINPAN